MNPTQHHKRLISAKLRTMTYTDIADAVNKLNTDNIDNITPRQMVSKRYSWVDMIGAIHPDRLKILMTLPTIVVLIEHVNNKDLQAMFYWVNALRAAGYITDEDVSNINTIVSATELDPNYKNQVSWAYVNLGRNVDAFDVMEALDGSN